MNTRHVVSLALVSALALVAGCRSSGAITVIKPTAGKLGGFEKLCVDLRTDNDSYSGAVDYGRSKLIPALKDEAWFSDVVDCAETTEPTLALTLTIQKYDAGSITLISRTEAEITMLGALKDAEGTELAQFSVYANSVRQGSASFGGVKTSTADNLPARAFRSAADVIADHLKLSR